VKLLADSFALLSLCFLSVPAWYINHYARLAARVTLTRVVLADAALKERHHALLEELATLRDGWKPWKAWCLHIGTVSGLLAGLLTLIVSAREATAPAVHLHS
jgi:hypothetical protein